MEKTKRRDLYNKKRYGVFFCPECHVFNISNMFQKRHTCNKCGKSIKLNKVHILFDSDEFKAVQIYHRTIVCQLLQEIQI